MSQSFFKVTLIIVILNSLGYMASEIYLPSFPSIESYFHTSEANVQFTLFVYMVSFTFSPLLFGPLSDQLGRGKVIRIGLIISIFATLGCTFAPNIIWLMVARFFQGVGFGAVTVATRSMLADFYEGRELNRQISYLAIAMPIFVGISPMIGGFIEHWASWREVFSFVVLYLLISYALSLRFQSSKTSKSKQDSEPLWSRYKALLKNKSFIQATLFMPVPVVGMFAYLTAGPFIYQNQLGLSPAEYGSLAIWNAVAIIIMGFLNSRLIDYWSTERMLFMAGVMMLVSSLIIGLGFWLQVGEFWCLLFSSLLFIGSLPIVGANCSQKAFASIDAYYGLASAIMMVIQFLGAILGTLIFSLIPDSLFPLMLCYASGGVVMFLLLVFIA